MNDSNQRPPDDVVQVALSALRSVVKPADLEVRTLARVVQRSEEPAHGELFGWISVFRHSRSLLLLSATVPVVILLVLFGERHNTRNGMVASTLSATSQVAMPVLTSARPVSSSRPRQAKTRPIVPAHPRIERATRHTFAAAEEGAYAADGPAPELPLTTDEQGLLRIAYPARPQQFASLKRVVLPTQPSTEEPNFDKFFDPYILPLTQGEPK